MSVTEQDLHAPDASETVDERDLAEIAHAREVALSSGASFVDLESYPLNAAAAPLLPETTARRHRALAVGWRYGTPVVAMAAPSDLIDLDAVKSAVGREFHVVVAAPAQIAAYIDRLYRPAESSQKAETSKQRAGKTGADTPAAVTHTIDLGPTGGNVSIADVQLAGVEAASATGSDSVEQSQPSADAGLAPTTDLPSAIGSVSEAEQAAAGAAGALLEGRSEAAPDPSAGGSKERRSPTEASDGHEPPTKGSKPGRRQRPDKAGDGEEDASAQLERQLLDAGQVTTEELEAARRERAATGRPLEEILLELGLVTEEDLLRVSAADLGLDYIDLNSYSVDTQAVGLIPETLARRHHVLAIGYRGETPIIGMANPSNVFALDDLRTLIGRDIHFVVCSAAQIDQHISRLYRHDQETTLAAKTAAQQTSVADATQSVELTDLHAAVEDAPIVRYVNLILRQALTERASDVHIEPSADDLRVRFRIDGVLHDVTRSPKTIQGGVTTRLKVMANLDIAEHRIPQDGRISLNAGTRQIDLRLATLPTVHGEKIVMRILDKSNAMLDLGDLGFLPDVLQRYESSYRKPYGTILVTGPTGSGKSTTLYATLNILNSPERNLITVEDPVEYQLRGVNQVQVNPKAGLTFAGALRSILRSDPDIVLVGEIRDRETAIIAIEAALTGHLVLSSLHTNNAAGTPMRLVEMGAEPFLVGSSLDCVLAQRLARQLCENCCVSYQPTKEELALFGWHDDDAPSRGAPHFRRAVGCQVCSQTGYMGRLAVHEILIVNEEIERAITSSATTDDIQRLAMEQGMTTLRHDGLRKAALGLTNLEEIARVVV